jgi:hypothetical protein
VILWLCRGRAPAFPERLVEGYERPTESLAAFAPPRRDSVAFADQGCVLQLFVSSFLLLGSDWISVASSYDKMSTIGTITRSQATQTT